MEKKKMANSLKGWVVNDVNSKDQNGRTPMHMAAGAGEIEMLIDFHKRGADIYARDDGDLSLMDSAVASDQIESIKCLVRELGMEVDASNGEGRTSMFNAAMLGKIESMMCLKNLGADVNAKDNNGCTPIHIAVQAGKTESIECLKALGADVEAKDKLGCTSIFMAAFSGDIETMKCLKDLGAKLDVKVDINGMTMTPIDAAGMDNHTKAQEWLRENMKKNETEKGSNATFKYDYFTDPRDDKKYKTVKIGSQVWLAENLAYNAPGSKCYGNDPANGQKYGRLYDWETAKKACPLGWHLPSDAEWQTLVDFAGGDKEAGNILKASSGWESNGNGVDAAGFSALPGGGGYSNGGFTSVGKNGHWWSATEINASGAYYRIMYHPSADVNRSGSGKSYLFSVRCVQD